MKYQFVDCRYELGDPARGRRLYLEGHVPGASFLDVGFVATGSVLYHYGTFPAAAAVVPPVLACGGAGFNNSATVLAAPGGGAGTDVGFYAFAEANLDADGAISHWGASNDNGAADCTVGSF